MGRKKDGPSKREYWLMAKELKYVGDLPYVGINSTKENWKKVYDDIVTYNEPKYNLDPRYSQDDDDIPHEVPLYQERYGSDDLSTRIVRFPVGAIMGFDTVLECNWEAFMETIWDLFMEVHAQVDHLKPVYQITVAGKGVDSIFSTPFRYDLAALKYELSAYLERLSCKYETRGNQQWLIVDYVDISYILTHHNPIKGMYKAISAANDKWLVLDTKTRKNCVFVAVYTALHWEKDPTLITNPTKRRKNAEKFKNVYLKILKDDAPTLLDIDVIAQICKIRIIVYNNIFETIATFNHVPMGVKPTIVEIQVDSGHAKALLRRVDVHRVNPKIQEEFDRQIVEMKANYDTEKGSNVKIRPKATDAHYNTRYVTWDVETYVRDKVNSSLQQGGDKEFVVYCSGLSFHEDFDNSKPITFHQIYTDDNNLKKFAQYIKDNIDTFDNTTFYAHNGGKFDLVLLMRDAFSTDTDFAIIGKKMVELDNALIGLSVKCRGKTIHFKDSYRMFQSSLKKLTHDLKVPNAKGEIDHSLVTSVTYMDMEKDISIYHKDDCVGLLQCADILSDAIYKQFKINMTGCFTGASLAKKIALTTLVSKKGVYKLDPQCDKFIRKSYKGGRNECFKLGVISGDIYYLDFTSLYPSCGTMMMPVGLPVVFDKPSDFSSGVRAFIDYHPMAFIRCRVRGTNEMLKNIKPLHGLEHNGRFVFPYLDTPTEMTLFSNEILEGLKLGYTYEPIDAIAFNKEYLLEEFFTTGFSNKAEAKKNGQPALEYMWKIIINSGYGFWGYNPHNKDTLKLYTKGSNGWLEYLASNRLIAVNSFGDYTMARVLNDAQPTDTNVAIASAITSYARIALHQGICKIEAKGGKVYYCDTDSIVCNLKLSDHPDLMAKYRRDGRGHNLGGLKNELGLSNDGQDLSMSKMTIVGCKMYSCEGVTATGQVVEMNKLKGYKKDSLLNSDLIEAMNNGDTVSQDQTQFLCNKSDYLRRSDTFNIRIATVNKSFKKIYSKGIINEDGTVTPLTL